MLPEVSGDFCLGVASGATAVLILTAPFQSVREYAWTYTAGILISTAAFIYGATVAPDGPEMLSPPAKAPEKPPKPVQRPRPPVIRPLPHLEA